MSATLLSIRTALRFRLRDTDTVNPRIADTFYNNWINRAMRKIAARFDWIEKSAALITDGTRYIYDLRGSGVDNVASDYLSMCKVNHKFIGNLLVANDDDVEDVVAAGQLASTDYLSNGTGPDKYQIYGDQIYFNHIPSAAEEQITKANSRIFTTGIGDWIANDGSIAEIADEGVFVADGAGTDLIELPSTGIDSLTVGQYFGLSLQLKYTTSWDGGTVTVNVIGDNATYSSEAVTLTTSYQTIIVKGMIQDSDVKITVTSTDTPTSGDDMQIDNASLKEALVYCRYHGEPEDLSGDSDEPPFPLNILDSMLIEAAYGMYLDDKSGVNGINSEQAMMLFQPDFTRLIARKGKNQNRRTKAHRI